MSTAKQVDRAATFWFELLSSEVHLDSLLAKADPSDRPFLATTIPELLRRPVTAAQQLGLSVPPGEPWSLDAARRAVWPLLKTLVTRWQQPGIDAEAGAHDFPPSMMEVWDRDFGSDRAAALARALGSKPSIHLRVRRKSDPTAILRSLQAEAGLEGTRSTWSPFAVSVASSARLSTWIRTHAEEVEIQDEGAQLVSMFTLDPNVLAPRLEPTDLETTTIVVPEWKNAVPVIVDACAGAGGKILAIGDMLKNRGRLFAYDVSARRLDALRTRARRAGLTNIKTQLVELGREEIVVQPFARSADIVLVDAPCSGWGVLRRNPDAKWRVDRDASSASPLEALQRRLLALYAQLVKPGGRLVYSLCTFRASECGEQVARFLEEHPDFELGPGGFIGPGQHDGFFVQSFERRAQPKARSQALQ